MFGIASDAVNAILSRRKYIDQDSDSDNEVDRRSRHDDSDDDESDWI